MGFRFRKSFNLGGGFKVNLSKSGIGYSWGGKGFRLTKTAKGKIRKTISIPGTGISYVDEGGFKGLKDIFSKIFKKSGSSAASLSSFAEGGVNSLVSNVTGEENVNEAAANVSDMVSDGMEDILAAARRTKLANNISTVGIGISVLLCFVHLAFIVLLVGCIVLKIYAKTAGQVSLEYFIDADQQKEIDQYMNPVLRIMDSQKVWLIKGKNSAKRMACSTSKEVPFPFKINIPAAVFKAGMETLVFLPDKLLILQANNIGAISYSDVEITARTTQFAEADSVPTDTKIVDKIWEHANKSGEPDKRYKNNRQLPVCEYGEIEFQSVAGFNITLMFSNPDLQ